MAHVRDIGTGHAWGPGQHLPGLGTDPREAGPQGDELGTALAGDPGAAPVLGNPPRGTWQQLAEPTRPSPWRGPCPWVPKPGAEGVWGLRDGQEVAVPRAAGPWCQRSPAETSPPLRLKPSGKIRSCD